MKHTSKIFILIVTFITSLIVSHVVYAQEFSPLAKLAQDYILRLNENTDLKETTIVNPESILQSAVEESIETITKTVGELQGEKQNLITEVKDSVKKDIDDSIIEIRKTTEKPAYELQRSIDTDRIELFENITKSIGLINPIEIEKIDDVETKVNESLQKIKLNLEKESGTVVNFDKSQRDIQNSFIKFKEKVTGKKAIVESREGSLVFKDSDQDGLSDYDEFYIYKTDPYNARTKSGQKTDGEKIQLSLNPLSDGEEKITYADPRDDRNSLVLSSYQVNKVQLVKEDTIEKLVFEGIALPNSYVTLYVFSSSITAVVKTDISGVWTYELKEKIENGEHQIYVATVDKTGKIIVRSNPILFTKNADAASIGIAGNLGSDVTKNFLKDNFILITLALIIAVVILLMMFLGNHKNIKAVVTDLKREIDKK